MPAPAKCDIVFERSGGWSALRFKKHRVVGEVNLAKRGKVTKKMRAEARRRLCE